MLLHGGFALQPPFVDGTVPFLRLGPFLVGPFGSRLVEGGQDLLWRRLDGGFEIEARRPAAIDDLEDEVVVARHEGEVEFLLVGGRATADLVLFDFLAVEPEAEAVVAT